jgi:sugar lactone lactonase YvrE
MTHSTLKPFATGDLFVAATLLNNPNDDHAGVGRIFQYDAAGNEKGVLTLADTTHLVGGLKFDSKGVLWAFDSQAMVVLNIHSDGRVVRRSEFPRRPFSHVNFDSDGTLLLGEHAVGSAIKPEIAARMHTEIPFMPGTDRFGDGHVWRFKPNGQLLKEYATQTHGGMGGFLGVTMSTLSPDGSTLVYCSETGPRLMRYDLMNDRQLPDLQSFQPPFQGPPEMFFGMEYAPDGTLYVLRGARIDVVSDSGQTTRQIALPGFGWAIMDVTGDGKLAYVSSFFTGEVLKIDLGSGAQLGSIKTNAVKAVAGVVEYQGEGTRAVRAAMQASGAAAAATGSAAPVKKATRRRSPAKRPKPAAARKVVRRSTKKRKVAAASKTAQRSGARTLRRVTRRSGTAAKRAAATRVAARRRPARRKK